MFWTKFPVPAQTVDLAELANLPTDRHLPGVGADTTEAGVSPPFRVKDCTEPVQQRSVLWHAEAQMHSHFRGSHDRPEFGLIGWWVVAAFQQDRLAHESEEQVDFTLS